MKTPDHLSRVREALADPEDIAARLGWPITQWARQCHAVSIAIVKLGILGPGARVARGWAKGVAGQHSWVVVGHPYDTHAAIADPTLWSYVNSNPSLADVPTIYVTRMRNSIFEHRPHGFGFFMDAGMPHHHGGPTITMQPEIADKLTPAAKRFLRELLPLDARGWIEVANLPVMGWPAPEIIAAMDDDRQLSCFVPIDILGMLTDRNPGGVYLPEREGARA
jgi:hypothetical protein